MPLYEYECEACGKRFEIIQKFSDAPADTCKVCGKGPVRRLLSSPAIQFKGSGWYITDYSQKGKPGAADKGDASPAEKDGKKDGTAGDSKTADTKAADKKPSSDGATSPSASPSSTSSKSDTSA